MASASQLAPLFANEFPPTQAFIDLFVEQKFAEREANWPKGKHVLKGRDPSASSIVLQSNDYLKMGSDPAVLAAAATPSQWASEAGVMAPVFLSGDSSQAVFERDMARFLGSDATLVSQSGWNANVGLLQAIGPATRNIYLDMYAHMSFIEGVHSAGCSMHHFRHNCVASLERRVREHGPGIVAVDSIYSTSGSVAPLADLARVCKELGCVLIVDESHSLGTHGPNGAGLVVALGLEDEVPFRTASLAKAFAARGGIIACSERHAEFVRFHSRPAIFSSALLPREIAVLQATLQSIQTADQQRSDLQSNAAYLRAGLIELGYDVNLSQSQILGLVSGEERRTIKLRDALEQRDIFGSVFCAPATPKNRSLVRFTVHSALSKDELDQVLEVCRVIRSEVNLDAWRSSVHRREGPRAAAGTGPARIASPAESMCIV